SSSEPASLQRDRLLSSERGGIFREDPTQAPCWLHERSQRGSKYSKKGENDAQKNRCDIICGNPVSGTQRIHGVRTGSADLCVGTWERWQPVQPDRSVPNVRSSHLPNQQQRRGLCVG